MELSKGATAGVIGVAAVVILGAGWFFFLRPAGGGGAPSASNAPAAASPSPGGARYDQYRNMQQQGRPASGKMPR